MGQRKPKSFEPGTDGYYSLRLRVVSREMKRKLDRAAAADGRSLNQWAIRLLMAEADRVEEQRLKDAGAEHETRAAS